MKRHCSKARGTFILNNLTNNLTIMNMHFLNLLQAISFFRKNISVASKKLLFFIAIIIPSFLVAQEDVFQGKIYDGEEKMALPFSHVSILNTLEGTTANEDGEFEINYSKGDSLVISYMGYKDEIIIPSAKNTGDVFYIFPNVNELPEILVRPLTIKETLKRVYENYGENIPQSPFSARSYLTEINTVSRKKETDTGRAEAVFVSNFPLLSDTSQNIKHRLVLYDSMKTDNGVDISFIFDNKKMKKFEAKQEEKKAEEDELEGSSVENITSNNPNSMLEIFATLLELPFIDTSSFDEFKYEFEESTTYKGTEVIVISFKSDARILAIETYKGKIFIDQENYGIVSLDFVEKMRIPAIVKPLIGFMMGFKVKGIRMYNTINFQQYKNHWYPKNIIENQTVTAYKTAAFVKTKKADLVMKRILNIDHIQLGNTDSVSDAENFDGKKPYLEQIYNRENMNWSDINRIKF